MTETKAQQECPYCHEHADLIHSEDIQGDIEFAENVYLRMSDDYENVSYTTKISYCPKCGRKLEVGK